MENLVVNTIAANIPGVKIAMRNVVIRQNYARSDMNEDSEYTLLWINSTMQRMWMFNWI
jgi:hypothetical protein